MSITLMLSQLNEYFPGVKFNFYCIWNSAISINLLIGWLFLS